MRPSHFAALNVVPLCARLVLCAVFLPAGWGKVFGEAMLTPAELSRLDSLGWSWRPPPAAPAGEAEAPKDAAPAAGAKPDAAAAPAEAKAGNARGLDKLALFLDSKNIPAPRWVAWFTGLAELLGGSLILIGIMSRFWGLCLAAVMVGAFYTTSLEPWMAHKFFFGMTKEDSATATLQLALFVLAFGVMLTGPGGLSLDRLLLGPPRTGTAPPEP